MEYRSIGTYRERQAKWREQAAELPPGSEQEACRALAAGYADLITILQRLNPPEVGTDI